eukprot:g19042.t1
MSEGWQQISAEADRFAASSIKNACEDKNKDGFAGLGSWQLIPVDGDSDFAISPHHYSDPGAQGVSLGGFFQEDLSPSLFLMRLRLSNLFWKDRFAIASASAAEAIAGVLFAHMQARVRDQPFTLSFKAGARATEDSIMETLMAQGLEYQLADKSSVGVAVRLGSVPKLSFPLKHAQDSLQCCLTPCWQSKNPGLSLALRRAAGDCALAAKCSVMLNQLYLTSRPEQVFGPALLDLRCVLSASFTPHSWARLKGRDCELRSQLHLAPLAVETRVRATCRVLANKKLFVQAAVKREEQRPFAMAELGLETEVGQQGKVGRVEIGVGVDTLGRTSITLAFRRNEFLFSLPLIIGDELSARVLTLTGLLCLSGYLCWRGFVSPFQDAQRESRFQASLDQRSAEIQAALEFQRTIEPEASRLRAQEERRGGLVILNARYGRIERASNKRDRGKPATWRDVLLGASLAIEDRPHREDVMDVTIPTQFQVHASKLQLCSYSKSQYLGFCRMLPEGATWRPQLLIQYTLNGVEGGVCLDDLEELRLGASSSLST